jgi:hypothetical protein
VTQPDPAGPDGPGPLVPLAEAVEGFVGLAERLVREIGGHARAVAERLGSGAYTPDLAARDAARSVALAVAASIRVANELFLDAPIILARPPEPKNRVTVHFKLEQSYDVPCTLSVARQLESPFRPPDVIGERRVTFKPQPLPAGETEFDVLVDATRMPGVPYQGRVAVTPDGGRAKATEITIVIQVT